MTAWADKKVGAYSKGMMQRIGLAQALASDPDLVLLDEPTDGVDPMGRRDIREVLMRMRQQGKTVFINSHLLSELEMICDRVAILVGGKVARQGRMDELNSASRRYEIEVVLPENQPNAIAESLGDLIIPAEPGAKSSDMRATLRTGAWVEIEKNTVQIGTIQAAEIQAIIDALRRGNLAISRVQPVKQSLEDLYLEAVVDPTTGRTAGAGAALNPQTLRAFPVKV